MTDTTSTRDRTAPGGFLSASEYRVGGLAACGYSHALTDAAMVHGAWWGIAPDEPPQPEGVEAGPDAEWWVSPLIERANVAINLSPNWDSYGALPLDRRSAIIGIQILVDSGFPGPTPWLSPTPDGGLHLEWESSGVTLEFEVDPDGEVSVMIDDGNDLEEIPLDQSTAASHLRSLQVAEATVAAGP